MSSKSLVHKDVADGTWLCQCQIVWQKSMYDKGWGKEKEKVGGLIVGGYIFQFFWLTV